MGNLERHLDAGPLHLPLRHPPEVDLGEFVVEHHQDRWPGTVVLKGALGGVVPQIGARRAALGIVLARRYVRARRERERGRLR